MRMWIRSYQHVHDFANFKLFTLMHSNLRSFDEKWVLVTIDFYGKVWNIHFRVDVDTILVYRMYPSVLSKVGMLVPPS